MKESIELSLANQEYLKAIYVLSNTKEKVRVTDISNSLNKTKATVNNALNILCDKGLITYEPYSSIELTELRKK